MVIVDTSVWIDYLNDVDTAETRWLDRELGRQRLGLLDLMLCEILPGVRSDEEAKRVSLELMRFEVFESGGIELATEAARRYRLLRARGRTVRKTIDCLIATFCLRGGHTLLHRDRDFEPFEQLLGLKVVGVDPPASPSSFSKTYKRFRKTPVLEHVGLEANVAVFARQKGVGRGAIPVEDWSRRRVGR
jgi:predicted nucleic acid-binding protein